MSFYAGKYGTKSQCHITNGSHDIVTMRGGVNTSTVFHSDIEYATYQTFTVTDTEQNYYLFGGNPIPGSYAFQFERTGWNLINAGHAYMIIKSDGGAIVNSGLYYNWQSAPAKTGSTPAYDYYPRYLWITYNDNVTPLYLIVFNFKIDGTFVGMPRSGSEIRIKKDQFTVSGIDIAKTKYINRVKINTLDYVTTPSSPFANPLSPTTPAAVTLQLINSKPKTDSIRFYSKIGDISYVEYGGHRIITSQYGTQKVSIKKVQTTKTVNWFASSNDYGPIATGFSTGDTVMFGATLYYKDTNGTDRRHDIQFVFQYPYVASGGRLVTYIEYRLVSSIMMVFKNGGIYLSIGQYVDGMMPNSTVTCVTL